MVQSKRLSVIIPVYNEEKTIASVIEIVHAWGKAKEIIIINDGSEDQSLQAIAQFSKKITLISLKTNKGKGYALDLGVQRSTGDIVMFLDGDIISLTFRDLDRILSPIVQGKADMVLGIPRLSNLGTFEPFNVYTGIRVMKRSDVVEMSNSWKSVGYGVELIMNEMYKYKQVKSVWLPFVFVLGKFDKQALPDAVASFVKEGVDMLSQVVRDQRDLVKPRARKVLQTVITYLQQAIS